MTYIEMLQIRLSLSLDKKIACNEGRQNLNKPKEFNLSTT